MKILLFGPNGQLGTSFLKKYSFIRMASVDISDYQAVKYTISANYPDCIINAAAYTNVDGAETNFDQAFRGNALGPKNIAQICFEKNLKMVHFSTDMVFYTTVYNHQPYREYDRPNPVSTYGKTKLIGEEFVRQLCPSALIIRTSWLYGNGKANFISKIKDKKGELTLPCDMFGYPTSCDNLVEQTMDLLDRSGTYHAACTGTPTNHVGWAKEILPEADVKEKHNLKFSSSIYSSPLYYTGSTYNDKIRSANSCLENYLLNMEGLNKMKDWKVALKEFLNG